MRISFVCLVSACAGPTSSTGDKLDARAEVDVDARVEVDARVVVDARVDASGPTWVKPYENNQWAFTTDAASNVYHADGSYLGGPLVVESFTADGVLRWSHAHGSGLSLPTAMAMRGNRIVVAGSFRDTMVLGTNMYMSQGQADIYVASFTLEGALVSSFTVGSSSQDDLWAVGIDDAGNITIGGSACGSLVLDATTTLNVICGNFGGFVASFDPAQRHRWSHAFSRYSDPEELPDSNVNDVSVAANGTVAVGGYFSGTIDFGGQVENAPYRADAFVATYEADGTLRMAKSFDGGDQDWVAGVRLTDDGSMLVGYTTYASDNVTADGFLRRFAPDGTYAESPRIQAVPSSPGGLARVVIVDVDFDAQRNLILTGFAWGDVRIGSLVLPNGTANRNLLIAGFDATTQDVLFARRIGTFVLPNALAAAPDGTLVIGGFSRGVNMIDGNVLDVDSAYLVKLARQWP